MPKRSNPGKPRNIAYEFVAGSAESIDRQFDAARAATVDWNDGEPFENFLARIPQLVADHTDVILDLAEPYDTFDLLELMRQYEFPADPLTFQESVSDSSFVSVELLAAILLMRTQVAWVHRESAHDDPRTVLEALHEHCRALIALGTFQILEQAGRSDHGPLTELAATSATHALNIRNRQYRHLQDEIDHALLASGPITSLLQKHVGFTYNEFLAVRLAVIAHREERIHSAGEAYQALLQAGPGAPDEHVEATGAALDAIAVHPGYPLSFTVDDIVDSTSLPTVTVQSILTMFTGAEIDPGAPPRDAVLRFLQLKHGLAGKQIIVHAGRYLALGIPIGSDSLRPAVETVLKPTRAWNQYERACAKRTEALALDALAGLLATEPAHHNLTYLAPDGDTTIGALNQNANTAALTTKLVEADGLFVIDDLAICVEVKAGSISDAARHGYVKKLSRDLEKTVGSAVHQAHRLEQLITTNGGLWAADGSWVDLRGVHEVRSVAVALDDLGVLGIAVDRLAQAGVLTEPQLAWVVSLHDLMAIRQVLGEPAEFLMYLRRRTDIEVVTRYQAVDELDLLMLFLGGDLYAEPDPDRLATIYPQAGPGTAAAQARYRQQPKIRRISTLTDPLDAWMYARAVDPETKVAKPRFGAYEGIREFAAALHQHGQAGWLRTGADVLGLAGDVHRAFIQRTDEIIRRTEADRRDHKALQSWPGVNGYPGVLIGTPASYLTADVAFERLRIYGKLKKHQLRLDRLTTLLIDVDRRVLKSAYDNSPWTLDPALDAEIERWGLKTEADNVKLPPAARRATRQLRGRRRKR